MTIRQKIKRNGNGIQKKGGKEKERDAKKEKSGQGGRC
jgi:hypothetical protein